MKGMKNKNNLKHFIIIILVLIIIGASTLLLFGKDIFNNFLAKKDVDIYFKLPFEEKEYKNIDGYDFYTKQDGTVLIKSEYDLSNIPSDGVTIDVNEKVVKIMQYTGEGSGITPNVLFLTENGNLYNLDLGQDDIDDSNLYKYNFDHKIKDLKEVNIECAWRSAASAAILDDDETRVIGPRNILLAPENYSLGKNVTMISTSGSYIVIENDNRVRIGDINKDKYYSISSENWINNDVDVTKYTYLQDGSNQDIKAKDIKLLADNDITYIYIITTDNRLIYLSVSEESLYSANKVIEENEIKLNKIPDSFASDGSSSTVRIKFTDNTYADIKNNNLIFGMLSSNNKFFAFAEQDLKNNIEYRILTDKLGVNYKLKDYAVVDATDSTNNTYILYVFMIIDDNKMIVTRISNNQAHDDISQMKVEEIKSDKNINKFEQEYSETDGYVTNIIFNDGTKQDLKSYLYQIIDQ